MPCCRCDVVDHLIRTSMMARALTGGWQVLRSLWRAGKHGEALDLLIRKMLELNPNATEERLRQGLRFNGDGMLEDWYLDYCNLEALPEEFGMVVTTGYLSLDRNQLRSLPESFGNVTVGGALYLEGNQISEWPKSFPNVKGKVHK